MTELLTNFISTILQILVFTFIPFVFFLFRKDKTVTFFKYIGLFKPTGKSVLYVLLGAMLFVIVGIGIAFVDDNTRQAVLSPVSVTGKLRQMGFNATTVTILLMISLFKTSLAEEILFRGFIAKQLVNKLGYQTGNILQATLFGIVHFLLFRALTQTTLLPLIGIFLFSSAAGWSIGYIKEKFAGGSTIPGWIAHALGNTVSYFVLAFVL